MLGRAALSTLFPYTTLFRSAITNFTSWWGRSSGRFDHRFRSTSPESGGLRSRITHTASGTAAMDSDRSEEHTSELQSRLHLVCRLLLEKKNPANSLQLPPAA